MGRPSKYGSEKERKKADARWKAEKRRSETIKERNSRLGSKAEYKRRKAEELGAKLKIRVPLGDTWRNSCQLKYSASNVFKMAEWKT